MTNHQQLAINNKQPTVNNQQQSATYRKQIYENQTTSENINTNQHKSQQISKNNTFYQIVKRPVMWEAVMWACPSHITGVS